jgi:hypothetical protein
MHDDVALLIFKKSQAREKMKENLYLSTKIPPHKREGAKGGDHKQRVLEIIALYYEKYHKCLCTSLREIERETLRNSCRN